ncbi:MAG: hypothetical protein J3R72DRAFT_432811 [Linnemannia gamsii]|nr:MAG: hypothetical protein J3R72DRAFT_432811 [Linnemannia gamsii]
MLLLLLLLPLFSRLREDVWTHLDLLSFILFYAWLAFRPQQQYSLILCCFFASMICSLPNIIGPWYVSCCLYYPRGNKKMKHDVPFPFARRKGLRR